MRPYSTLPRVCLESERTELFFSSIPQSRKEGGGRQAFGLRIYFMALLLDKPDPTLHV